MCAAGAAYLGVAGGASRATLDASAEAATLAAQGHFADAMALDDAVARRTGPLYLFAAADVSTAPLAGQRVLLSWAEFLDRHGRVDEAVAVAGGVTDPRLRAAAANERAAILLDAARTAAAAHDYSAAITRLEELRTLAAAGPSAAVASSLLPQYQVGEAETLSAQGDGADAVALLDQVSAEGGAKLAAAAYPAALLAAGREELQLDSNREAAATLRRLVATHPAAPQAAQARALLAAPQPVTGTLVDRSGQPISGQVRLSSHFFSVPGGYYTTGPFYYATADASGTFHFADVPVGGPYVLEVYRGGDWTTYVDPATAQPATPVTVTALQPVNLTFIELP